MRKAKKEFMKWDIILHIKLTVYHQIDSRQKQHINAIIRLVAVEQSIYNFAREF